MHMHTYKIARRTEKKGLKTFYALTQFFITLGIVVIKIQRHTQPLSKTKMNEKGAKI